MTNDSEEMRRLLAGEGRRKSWRIWLGLALLAVLALGAWYWFNLRSDASAVSYETEQVTSGPLTVTVTATGAVEPTTQVDVSSELSGTLESVEVDYNDDVEVDQVLARLDDTKLAAQVRNAEASLAAAEAALAQAEASAREAEANYEAQKELDRRGVTTRLSFMTYVAANDRAKAAVDAGRADVSLAEANLVQTRADLENSVIRSPIRGIVLNRAAEAGQIVASSLNAPVLFTLAEDLTRMELLVDIDEADIGRVSVGNAATFTVDAYSGRSFPAEVTQVRYAPETTEGVVTYKAVLSVENGDRLLRPGMTATATITVAEVPEALLVPNAALRFEPPQVVEDDGESGGGLLGMIMPRRPATSGGPSASDANTLWVLRDGQAVEVEIAPGDSDGRYTAVTSEDLVEGDLVIVDQGEAG